MYLKRLNVQRFKGLKDANFEFTPGLNVIYGPNEAGKSTLQAAISALLFIEAKSAKAEGLRTWGYDELPYLHGIFETVTGETSIIKDFATAKTQFISVDGKKSSDARKVREEIVKLIGLAEEEVYNATACLSQLDWARVNGGAKLQQMLQDSLAGAARGGVEEILHKLEKALTEMRRGTVRVADKNPGPLAIALQEQNRIAANLAIARSDAQAGDMAREEIQTARTRLNEIAQELKETEALQVRCQEYLTLEKDHRETVTLAQNLETRTRRISELQAAINRTEVELGQLTQIPPQDIDELNRLIERCGYEQKAIDNKKKRIDELQAEINRLNDNVGHSERLEQLRKHYTSATELRNNIEVMIRQSSASQDLYQQLEMQIQALRHRAKPIPLLAGIGALLFITGIIAGLNNPVFFIISILGLIPLGIAFTLRPTGLSDLQQRLQDQQQTVSDETTVRHGFSQELAAILTTVGTQDIEELSSLILKLQEEAANRNAILQNRQDEFKRLQDDLWQSEILLRKINETIAEKLATHQVEKLEQLQEKFNRRKLTEDENRDAQNTLSGLLGQDSIPEIRDAHSRAALRLLALEEKLDSPELNMAKMTPVAYQKLLDRLRILREEQENLRHQLHEAEKSLASRHHDSDDVKQLEGQLAEITRRVEMLRERLDAWELAREVITVSRDNTMRSVTTEIVPEMTRLLEKMTAGRYTQAILREDLTPVVMLPDIVNPPEIDPESLSCATQEQVYLAARLAIINMLWQQGGPPVLMDDPLVNFDATRREATILALQEFAKKRQVILFTCHDDYRSFASQYIEILQPV